MTDKIQAKKDALETRERELARIKEWKARLKKDRTTLLGMPEFRRVMSDIIARGGMFQSVMTGNSMTYHKSGRQDFTREIWRDLAEADLDAAHDLLKPMNGEKNG